MILRTKKDNDVIMFELEGFLDFESIEQFKDRFKGSVKRDDRVLVNMKNLKFVGSSSITHFIRTLKEFNSTKIVKNKLRICNLSSDFEKVFKVYQSKRNKFEIFPDERTAIDSFVSNEATKKVKFRKRSI